MTFTNYQTPLNLFLLSLLFSLLLPFGATGAGKPLSPCPFVWTKNLTQGAVGDDVIKLQQFLNASETTVIAIEGPGSSGKENKNFGKLTRQAVIKFQEKYASEVLAPADVKKGTGIVGSLTRKKLNSLCSTSSVPPIVSAESASVISSVTPPPSNESEEKKDVLFVTAGEQPPATLAPSGAIRVPFTKVTLTAGKNDVTVHSMTIERTGASTNASFDAVAILDEEGFVINSGTLHSDRKITIDLKIVIPAGTSQTLTVAGDIAVDLSAAEGQVALLQVKSINASAPIEGSLPIRGSFLTLSNNLHIGTVTTVLSSLDPGNARTFYINDTNVKFSGIRLTAGSNEDVKLYSITWTQGGTISDDDIANVATVVNEISYPALADDRSFTSVFPEGILIKKGTTLDMYIKGDLLVKGVNRNVRFDIAWPDDIFLVGQMYGYGIYPTADGNTATEGNSVFLTDDGTTEGTAGNPFFIGSVATISGGSFNSVDKR